MRSAILAVLLTATAYGALSRLLPCSEHRHPSGILLVCHDGIAPWVNASEELKAANSFAMELAQANPDLFGYPTPDFDKGEVVLRIVRPDAERLARVWIASGLDLPAPFGKVRSLPRPTVPVRFEPATRTVALLETIKDDVGPNLKDLPDSNAMSQSGADIARNATRYVVDRESDALLRALAARYGTEALVVEVDPDRPNFHF